MNYKKVVKRFTEYEGESFSQAVSKKGGGAWEDNETAVYSLIDTEGVVQTTGNLIRSEDKKSLGFLMPSSVTAGLSGKHVIFVDMLDTDNTDVRNVIAEYAIEYTSRKAS